MGICNLPLHILHCAAHNILQELLPSPYRIRFSCYERIDDDDFKRDMREYGEVIIDECLLIYTTNNSKPYFRVLTAKGIIYLQYMVKATYILNEQSRYTIQKLLTWLIPNVGMK